MECNSITEKKLCLRAQATKKSHISYAFEKGNKEFYFILKALSHYNVLANVCRLMKYISSMLAYVDI